MSTLIRETKETTIRVRLGGGALGGRDVDAGGAQADRPDGDPEGAIPEIRTDDPFLSHMLVTLARYSGLPLSINATGDLKHHLVEDVAITLGAVLERHTPSACVRYGQATIPMDDALVQVAIDAGGRPHYEGDLPSSLYDHFFRSLALNARWTIHVRVIRGRDRHHSVEAAFKALGLAIRQAMAETGAVFSTKGSVALDWEGEPDAG